MSVTLAATWDPRGEWNRLERLKPLVEELYQSAVVVLPPDADAAASQRLRLLNQVEVVDAPEWPQGRYLSLAHAARCNTDYIHYVDLDRWIRWAETRPDELRQTVARLRTVEVLMIGRTDAAFATHPQALQRTEKPINTVFSYLLGQPFDFPSGSRGFSRDAAAFLVGNTLPQHGLGTDTEWPVLLRRAGYRLEPCWVDGLDWETADRYRDTAADAELQRAKADEYDANPTHWAYRADIAQAIIEAGLNAMQRSLKQEGTRHE